VHLTSDDCPSLPRLRHAAFKAPNDRAPGHPRGEHHKAHTPKAGKSQHQESTAKGSKSQHQDSTPKGSKSQHQDSTQQKPATAKDKKMSPMAASLLQAIEEAILGLQDLPEDTTKINMNQIVNAARALLMTSLDRLEEAEGELSTSKSRKRPLTGNENPVSSPQRRARVAPVERILKQLCEEFGEDYAGMLQGMLGKKCVPQASIIDNMHQIKDGHVMNAVQKDLEAARKALTKGNLVEIARTLELICVPDSAYHQLRTKCNLQSVLPSLYGIKKNRAALNTILMEELNIQQLVGGGHLVDYSAVWDIVLELLGRDMFPETHFPDDKLQGIFTFDGREIGGRKQVYVGLKFPWLDFGNSQSCKAIFPIAILPGTDDVSNLEAKFNAPTIAGGRSLMQQIQAVQAEGTHEVCVSGIQRSILKQQIFVGDQKSMWSFFNCCQSPMRHTSHKVCICTFCMCTNDPDEKADFSKSHAPRPTSGLGVFSPWLDCTFCLLHAKLRICEKLLELTSQKAIQLKKMSALQTDIRKQDIQMTISADDKKKAKCTSMNGRDCEKLVASRAEWLTALNTKKNTEASKQFLSLWNLWDKIFNALNRRYGIAGPGAADLAELRTNIADFGALFLTMFERVHVTPYIHIIMKHAADHLEKYKDLWRYAQEGFEAANKLHRMWNGRATQRGGCSNGSNQHVIKTGPGKRAAVGSQLLFKNWRVLYGQLQELRDARQAESYESDDDSSYESEGGDETQADDDGLFDDSDSDSDYEDNDDDDDGDGLLQDDSADADSDSDDDDDNARSHDANDDETDSSHLHLQQMRAPLNEREERTVIEALSKPHFITCKHKGIGKIKHCELECYTMQGPHKELTTTNIEAAFRVMTNCDDNTLYLPNSTFWFDRLHKEGFAAVKTWKATKILTGYVRALWRKEGGKPEGRVLIPIHRPGHWVLACINLTAQRLEHYDSCYGSAAKAAGELQTIESLLRQLRGEDTLPKKKLRELTLEDHFIPGKDIPQQYKLSAPDEAGVDCGVFTIFYALACQHDIDITQQQDWQQDMATLRKRVVLGLHEGRLTLK